MGDLWRLLTSEALAPTFGFLGFLLGAVGFPITIWQLLRTKKAAHSAEEAANNARVRLTSFSALRELELARSKAINIKEAVSRDDWSSVPMLYQELAHSLMQLSESDVAFEEDVRVGIHEAVAQCEANCAVVETTLASRPDRLQRGKQLSALRKVETPLARAATNLERLAL
jgi:hypothetical protein